MDSDQSHRASGWMLTTVGVREDFAWKPLHAKAREACETLPRSSSTMISGADVVGDRRAKSEDVGVAE
jgi:hypothetical protein